MVPTNKIEECNYQCNFYAKAEKIIFKQEVTQCSCQSVYFGIPVNNETEFISDFLRQPWKK